MYFCGNVKAHHSKEWCMPDHFKTYPVKGIAKLRVVMAQNKTYFCKILVSGRYLIRMRSAYPPPIFYYFIMFNYISV